MSNLQHIRVNLDNYTQHIIKRLKEISEKEVVKKICRQDGFNLSTTIDKELSENINARISIGKKVAEAKIKEDPSILNLDSEKIREKLTRKERECQVIKKAKRIAKEYRFDEEAVEKLFEWIIERTKDVEVEYIMEKKGTN